jgi:hypothetical protein
MNHPLCPDTHYSEYDPINQECYNLKAVAQSIHKPTTTENTTPSIGFGVVILIALAAMFLKRTK